MVRHLREVMKTVHSICGHCKYKESKCKCPEARVCLVCERNSQETNTVAVEWMEEDKK